ELLEPEGISWSEVLIAGDEFGPIAGFAGSDDLLRTGVMDAVVVSVGAEPNGVPPGVIHLGGGPATFRRILQQQIALRGSAPAPTDVAWQIVEDGYDPALEHEIESIFAVGNGFIGVRAALEPPTS